MVCLSVSTEQPRQDTPSPGGPITGLLLRLSGGDAGDALLALVHSQLHALAGRLIHAPRFTRLDWARRACADSCLHRVDPPLDVPLVTTSAPG